MSEKNDITLKDWLGNSQLGTDIIEKKYLIRDGESIETFMQWVERVSGGNEDVKRLFIEQKFIPAGRILSNRGLNNKGIKSTLSNCYVLSTDDSIEDIYKTCSDMARTYSYGGGVGIDISKLRPSGAVVHNSAQTTTGAVSFMKSFDTVTGTIGQCIDGKQYVITKNGLTRIEDVVIGDYVYTQCGFVKVVNKINQGVKPVYRTTTKNGYSIVTTNDHPFITCDENNPLKVAKLSELNENDNVVILGVNHDYNTNKDYVQLDTEIELPVRDITNKTGKCGEMVHNKYMQSILPNQLDEKLGYLLGYISGDGYTSKRCVDVSCNSNDIDIIEKICTYSKEIFGVDCNIKDCKTYKVIFIGGKEIKMFLDKNGLAKEKTDNLRIPKSVFNSCKEVQMAYLSGLMDADGTVSKKNFYKITTVNKDFCNDIQLLFNINGIITKVHKEVPKNPKWKEKYNICIIGSVNKNIAKSLMCESIKVSTKNVGCNRDSYLTNYTSKTIGFNRNSKHNYIPSNGYISANCVQKLKDEGLFNGEIMYKDSIKSITECGNAEVFDITLESENMFWCNGFYVHNCGRRGALMISIDVNHPDLPEFVNIKANTDQITNANISIRVNNKFMEAVNDDKDYFLRWPCNADLNSIDTTTVEYNKLFSFVLGKDKVIYVKKVKAKDLFMQIAKNNWDYGEPGVLYWDRISKWHMMSDNKEFEYAGVNPCVSGDTVILTDNGYQRIDTLVGKKVNVWNGYEWSEVEPRVTGHNQEMLLVTMSNGTQINCTKYHKFVLKDGSRVEAKDLKIGDKLVKCKFPVIDNIVSQDYGDSKTPYTMGFFAGDGYVKREDEPIIYLYGDKKKCLPYILDGVVREDEKEGRTVITLTNHRDILKDKYYVPGVNMCVEDRLNWLAGLIDSDGYKNDKGGSISISSINKDFLKNVQYMLNTLGIASSINVMHKHGSRPMPKNDGSGEYAMYDCKESYRLVISSYFVKQLQELGLELHRVDVNPKEKNNTSHNIKIVSIIDNGMCDTVYCMNEPKNHTFISNGCIVGNCAEEPLPNGGACLLGSMNLYKYVIDGKFDWEMFDKDVRIATIGLNEIQKEGTDLHPLTIQRETAEKYRQIGLGIFDIAGALIKMKIKYGSNESKEFANKVTHAMLISAFEQSCDLNTNGIVYEGMFESEFYKNRIEPYIKPQYKGRYPLNSQLLTIAPTGSISTMINAGAGGGEPIFRISYTRDTKSIGEKTYHVCSNAVLDYFNGDPYSVNESELPDYFVTADKIAPKDRIEMQSALQTNIDASISSTINLPKSATVDDVYNIYMYAWKMGLKGVTVFREGCKRTAILKSADSKEVEGSFNTVNAPKRPKVLDADYYQVKVQGENFIIIVGLLDDKPYELFALPCDNCQKIKNHKGKITRVNKREYKFESDILEIDNIAIEMDKDYDITGEVDKISEIVNEGHKLTKLDTELIRESVNKIIDWLEKREYRNVALHVSGNLRTGMRIEDIIKLEEKCGDSIVSFPKAISRVLSKYREAEETDDVCPECGTKLINEGGCCHCPNCGYSHCG